MFKKVLFIVALMAFVSSASAGTYYYDNATGDGLWVTPGNWAAENMMTPASARTYPLTAPPTTSDRGYVGGGLNPGEDILCVVRVGDVGTSSRTRAGFTGSTATPQGTSTIEVYGSLYLGPSGTTYAQNCDTSWLIDGGYLQTTGGNPYMGKITMNIVNGGVVDAGAGALTLSYPGQVGCLDLLNIDDGSFSCGSINIGDASVYLYLGIDIVIGANGVMYVDDVDGSQRDIAVGLYNDSLLYAGVAGEGLSIVWDGVGLTTIQIPEPATIALLGLGGLLLRKRR